MSGPSLRLAKWWAAASILVLAGCTAAQQYVDHYGDPEPSLAKLSICHGYGCRLRTLVGIEPEGWGDIVRLFEPAPVSAATERTRLARAIAFLEIKIGAAVGTSTDRSASSTFGGEPDQLDCIDETVNTTTYLRLLAREGLMRRHVVGIAAQRGSVSGFAYNDFITNTAVIVETATGASYAVDSYFYPNGRAPKIMPLAKCATTGGRPERSVTKAAADDVGPCDRQRELTMTEKAFAAVLTAPARSITARSISPRSVRMTACSASRPPGSAAPITSSSTGASSGPIWACCR